MAKLFAVLPTYDGTRYNAQAYADLLCIQNMDVHVQDGLGSLLTLGFNRGWADALNWQADFFLLLHADIMPMHDDWINLLFGAMVSTGASAVAAVSPIKTNDGLTSTALDTDFWSPRRLTMTEVHERPETWTEDGLLLNTGMLLVDFRQPWVHQICFTMNDRITKLDGKYVAQCEPEDWNFSRQARALGASLYATRAVPLNHIGYAAYENQTAWGSRKTDPLAKAKA